MNELQLTVIIHRLNVDQGVTQHRVDSLSRAAESSTEQRCAPTPIGRGGHNHNANKMEELLE